MNSDTDYDTAVEPGDDVDKPTRDRFADPFNSRPAFLSPSLDEAQTADEAKDNIDGEPMSEKGEEADEEKGDEADEEKGDEAEGDKAEGDKADEKKGDEETSPEIIEKQNTMLKVADASLEKLKKLFEFNKSVVENKIVPAAKKAIEKGGDVSYKLGTKTLVMTYDFATEMANSPWVHLFLALGFMADASAPRAEEVKNVATWMGLGENIAEWFILKSGIIEAPPTVEIPIPMWYTLSRIAENMLRKGAKGVLTHMGMKVAKGIVKELGFLREAKQIVDDTHVADFAKLGWMACTSSHRRSHLRGAMSNQF